MCGIAGIMYKHVRDEQYASAALIDMLDGCQHRGPDSTGFAPYGSAEPERLRLRFYIGVGEEAEVVVARIKHALNRQRARIVDDEIVGINYRAVVEFRGDLQQFAYDMEHAAKVFSIGDSLDVIKDVGGAHDVDDTYHVHRFQGSHGLGHVR